MTYNFENLRLATTFDQGVMVKQKISTIPVRRPRSNLDFFRIRPGDEWQFPTYLLDIQEGDEGKYLVVPELFAEASALGKLKRVTIFMGITYPGDIIFLSDIPLPNEDGSDNGWNRSRRLAYKIAEKKWIKLRTNKDLGAYEIIEAVSELPEPVWPDEPKSIVEALSIAFKDSLVDRIDHPVLKRLRGEL